MSTLIPGFIAILAIVAISVGGGRFQTYFQMHSMILVLGGTAAIFALSTPFGVVKSVYRSLIDLFKPEESFSSYQSDLNSLLKNKRLSGPSASPLIAYASELWEQGVDADLFVVLVAQKRSELEAKYADSVQSLKNLSKYPPALGMIGTVMGMVSLFTSLDENRAHIGTHLSLAMTATFFGLIAANAVIAPLADRVQVRQVQQHRLLANLYEILLLINRDEPSSLINDEVVSRAS